GGLRTAAAVERVLEGGAARAVVGTVAVRDPALCAALCRAFPGRVAVGIDARDGLGRVAGWAGGGGGGTRAAGRARGGGGGGGSAAGRASSTPTGGGTGCSKDPISRARAPWPAPRRSR